MADRGVRAINISSKSIVALDDFAGQVNIPTFNRKLRNLLLYYLINEHDELPPTAGEFIQDMQFLLEMLDVVGDDVIAN